MNTDRLPERLVFFTDAVVAIALTLLILPLTEIVPELVSEHKESFEAITGNQWQIYSFLLSFAVIARQWLNHHRLFEQVKAYSRPLMEVNLLWLLTIVILPFPTEMVGGFDQDQFTVAFYIGTIFLNSLCYTAMVLIVSHDEKIQISPDSISAQWRMNSIGSTLVLAIALVLGALFTRIGYFAILFLLIPPVVSRWWYSPQRQIKRASR